MKTFIFNTHTKADQLDHRSFNFKHNLCDHPLLKLDSLKTLLLELPRYNVSFSSDDLNLKSDFEVILTDKTMELDFNKIIPSLLTTKSYIAAKGVENHPAYKELCDSIVEDIKAIYQNQGKPSAIKGASFWLFIASPNAVTPFHFDRFSNFIFQIRGSKELAVFPNFRDDIIHHTECEKYCSGEVTGPLWRDEIELHAHRYDFRVGDAVHIPFTSGHYVKNGSEDISISLSVFFHTKQTLTWSRAHRVNHYLRGMGLRPRSVGTNKNRNMVKSYLLPMSLVHQKIRASFK